MNDGPAHQAKYNINQSEDELASGAPCHRLLHNTPIQSSVNEQPLQVAHRRVSSNQLQKQEIAQCLLMHDHKYNSHMFNELVLRDEERMAFDLLRSTVTRHSSDLNASN